MKARAVLGSTLSLALVLLTSGALQVPALAGRQDRESAAPALPDDPQPEGWIAADTSVSALGAEEQAALCGVPLEVIEWEELQARQQPPRLAASYTYPSALDWRSYNGKNWTTPIRHQGGCASCAAFAAAAAIESRMEIAQGNPDLNPDLSEAHLFYCGCGACCSTGSGPTSLLNFARDTGVVDELCFPYVDQNRACSLCQGWQTRVTKIHDWVGLAGAADIKQALFDAGPIEATMVVYGDFFNYSEGVYRHTSGDVAGAHAVTIVGYNDSLGYWIAKNSWGADWGEKGWFRIAYGECSIDNYVYVPFVAEPSSYRVDTRSWPDGGGLVAADPPDCTVDGCPPDTEVVLTANPSDHYKFSGWSGDVSGWSNPTSIVLDCNKDVNAHFIFSCDDCTPRAFLPLVMRQ